MADFEKQIWKKDTERYFNLKTKDFNMPHFIYSKMNLKKQP